MHCTLRIRKVSCTETSSPANVLLDTDGTVWLTDFGLAQAADDPNLTRSGDIVGTLRYLAPEWLRGECSRQSDVYGLGITLYALVTFAPAFAENDRATLIHQIVQQDPKRPRSINHNVPRDLETVILKAIEKEATRRYLSAGALADDLSRFLSDRPIRARRVVLVEQAELLTRTRIFYETRQRLLESHDQDGRETRARRHGRSRRHRHPANPCR